jgi:flagellar basal body rod protein FlgC
VSHRWVYDPGVVHAVRKDFVGEHKISKAKGDKRDYYPQHNIANNAGKVNAANKPAIFPTVDKITAIEKANPTQTPIKNFLVVG